MKITESRRSVFAYLTGMVAGGALCLVALKLPVWDTLARGPAGNGHSRRGADEDARLVIDKAQFDELVAAGGLFDNCYHGKGGGADPHSTLLVQPDPRTVYRLRPNVTVIGRLLRTPQPSNYDPPVLYLPPGASLSARTREFLRRNTRLSFTYRTDAEGCRLTLPPIKSGRRLIVIGDSVAFGMNVNDASTLPSQLQRLLGRSLRVVNAGVGGYSGKQVMERARILLEQQRSAHLVYVACHNDFFPSGSRMEQAVTRGLEQLGQLRAKVDGRIVVLLVPPLPYITRHLFVRIKPLVHRDAWVLHQLRRLVAERCTKLGLVHLDFTAIAAAERRRNPTILSAFSLYSDKNHLSPRGNRLAAEAVARSLTVE